MYIVKVFRNMVWHVAYIFWPRAVGAPETFYKVLF